MTPKIFHLCVILLCFSARGSHASTSSMSTPENEAAFLGKHLKGIPDDQWKTIAGAQLTETYSIITGDTLFDISHRLFGDAKYWPKVWALNNANITNPHRILPGNRIIFSPGTGSSLPGVTLAENGDPNVASDASSPIAKFVARSTDWKFLPRQKWESYIIPKSPEIDALGFDRNNKISFHHATGFDLQAIPAKDKITPLGEIVGSRSEGSHLAMYDTVYIRSQESLKVGETYAISDEPVAFKFEDPERDAYSYLNIGKVKIEGVQDNLFIGTILSARGFVARGSILIPLPPRVPVLTPIPGLKPIEGKLYVDHRFSTYTVSQYKEVFVNRGSDDGIQPGMVFRAYEHNDPSTSEPLTKANFIIDADLMITHVSGDISSALIISSKSTIIDGAAVVLLTDVSDLTKNKGFREKGADGQGPSDEVEKLDKEKGEGAEDYDKKELKQLEDWKKNPEGTDPTQSPSDPAALPPPPDTDNPPPPPGEPPAPPATETSGPSEISTPPPSAESSENPPPPPSSSESSEPPPPPAFEPPSSSSTSTGAPPPPANEAPISLEPPPPAAAGE
jgi:hypothetical protein